MLFWKSTDIKIFLLINYITGQEVGWGIFRLIRVWWYKVNITLQDEH